MTKQPLIIINGWGGTEIIWQPLMQRLSEKKSLPFSEIRCIDLPGFGNSADIETDKPLDWLADVLPEKCYALVWSLGGQLACALAELEPERFVELFLIASNPQFVASNEWPGMAPQVFADFQDSFNTRPEKTWKKFKALCAANEACDVNGLISQWPQPVNTLQAARTLSWLASMNSHSSYHCTLLAEQDALVPVSLAAKMPQATVVAGSHLLPYCQPAIIEQWLIDCFRSQSGFTAC